MFVAACNELGLPLKSEKMEGPATVIEFLGIILDTATMEIRLSESRVKQLVDKWSLQEGMSEMRTRVADRKASSHL